MKNPKSFENVNNGNNERDCAQNSGSAINIKSWGTKFKKLAITVTIFVAAFFLMKTVSNFTEGNFALSNRIDSVVLGEEGKVSTFSVNELEDMVKSSKLYTAEYPYNSYVPVCTEKGDVMYYVAYNGTVKAGIDVSEIAVDIDSENKIIYVYLPQVNVYEPIVYAEGMEYIFMKKKYNTETVASEAYKVAIADLKKKVSEDDEIIRIATESAVSLEKAMVDSWVNKVGNNDYQIEVVPYGEEERV